MSTNLVLILALTIFGEAAGEPAQGKRAVASVIWHRAQGNPHALEGVCRKPRQFSCWNAGIPPKVPRDAPSRKAWAECVSIASSMAIGMFTPILSATHYHAANVSPKWARNMRLVAVIGGHRFYREVANG